MKTYSYAQELANKHFKGYKFVVSSSTCDHLAGSVVANIVFLPFDRPNKQLKQLALCKLLLFQPRAGLHSVALLVTASTQKKQLFLEFRIQPSQSGVDYQPAENTEYVFFQDLVGNIKNKFEGGQFEKGLLDFFFLVETLGWNAEAAALKKQREGQEGVSWTSILLGAAAVLLVGGLVGLILKKQQ